MKKEYITPREQYLKCKANGNLMEGEKCYGCEQPLLICKKYGGQCNSGKCREERTNKMTANAIHTNQRLQDINETAEKLANDLCEEIGVWKIQDLADSSRFVYVAASVESFLGQMGQVFKCEFKHSFKPN